MTDLFAKSDKLINPNHLWFASDIIANITTVPKVSGVYAWYFKDIPEFVLTDHCREINGWKLLYVGIAPKGPGKPATLRDRIQTHLAGIAEFSTLRYSSGSILSEKLGIKLEVKGKDTLTFGKGEDILSKWMAKNASLSWILEEKPWILEKELIKNISLPLNIQHNRQHPFASHLTKLRVEMKNRAFTSRWLG